MHAGFPRARSWVLALPMLVALAACDRTPTEPFPAPFAAAKGGNGGSGSAKAGAGRIAFGSDHQGFTGIYVVDPDGQNLALVTMPPAGKADLEPSLAPGGNKVAFTRSDPGTETSELYVANVNGGTAQQLTGFGVLTGSPAFSPDGKKIAFVSDKSHPGATAPVNLYVMNLDGSNLQLVDSTIRGSRPAWSADGAKLYYATGIDSAPGTDFGGVHQYALMAKHLVSGTTTWIWWSPNSTVANPVVDFQTGRIMIEQQELIDPAPFLTLLPGDTGIPQVLVDLGFARPGGWSKDGTRFVYAPNYPTPMALRILDVTSVGSGTLVTTDLVTPAVWAQAPTWSR